MITTIELLEFLTKAQQLSTCSAIFRQVDEGYYITLYCDWEDDGSNYKQCVFISNQGESNWDSGDYPFEIMNDMLDEMVEREEQKEIKAQKRQELIQSLTPEQRELLGV
jgi:hypothetical protein